MPNLMLKIYDQKIPQMGVYYEVGPVETVEQFRHIMTLSFPPAIKALIANTSTVQEIFHLQ